MESDRAGLLFFSTRQGRQTNCVLTVEVARFVAERLRRNLVLPLCHTSPLGQQACARRPAIPPNAHSLVSFSLTRALQAQDLGRCRRDPTSRPALSSLLDLPLSAAPHNATCLVIVADGSPPPKTAHARTPCDDEVEKDPEFRGQAHLQFTRTVFMSPSELTMHQRVSPGVMARLPPPSESIFLHEPMLKAWHALEGKKRRHFRLCALPRETDDVVRMAAALEAALGTASGSTLCMHWRGEDFHHPGQILRYRQNTSSAESVASKALQACRRHACTQVLLLSNARYEGVGQLLDALRRGGIRAESARNLRGTSFGCSSGFVYGTFAEMLACSRARSFLGSRKSQFSAHILAMREARGAPNATRAQWL
jgi:hypothetical protein